MVSDLRQSVTIGHCADLLSGGTPSKENKSYWGGSIPWVSAKDMKRFRLHDAEDHVTVLGAKNGTRVVPTGSILVLVRGMTLHNDVPVCVTGLPMALNQDVKALIPKPHVNSDYLAYWLLAHKPNLLQMVDSASHGTGRIFTNDIRGMELELPPLPEQRAIAAILGALDDKIELNTKMNRTLEAMAKATFKSWFVDFDPVRAKMEGRKPYGMDDATAALFPDSFEESELGPVPKGWGVQPLWDVAKFINGAAYRDFHFTTEPGALPIVKIAEVKNGVTSQTKFTKTELAAKYRIGNGDILFSWSGNPDTSIDTFVWTGGPAWLNQHIYRVGLNSPEDRNFVYYQLLALRPVFAEIARNKQTTGLGHVTARDMKEMLVPQCPPGILRAFNDCAGSLYDARYANLLSIRDLHIVRDTLLPKLISGEIRIKDAEKLLEGTI